MNWFARRRAIRRQPVESHSPTQCNSVVPSQWDSRLSPDSVFGSMPSTRERRRDRMRIRMRTPNRPPPMRPDKAIGMVLVIALICMTALSILWSTDEPLQSHLGQRLLPPGLRHAMGTDAMGRDMASLVLAATEPALLVSALTVAIGMCVGGVWGLLAAFARGRAGTTLMAVTEMLAAFPAVPMAILLGAAFERDSLNAVIAIGLALVPAFARVTHAGARDVLRADYVAAARLAGKGGGWVLLRHVLPNISKALWAKGAAACAVALLAETSLSYLGLGIALTQPSWGRLLAEAQPVMAQAPWLLIFPGMAVLLATLGFSLLGDGLRAKLITRSDPDRVL